MYNAEQGRFAKVGSVMSFSAHSIGSDTECSEENFSLITTKATKHSLKGCGIERVFVRECKTCCWYYCFRVAVDTVVSLYLKIYFTVLTLRRVV
jgi:hypothetical protein